MNVGNTVAGDTKNGLLRITGARKFEGTVLLSTGKFAHKRFTNMSITQAKAAWREWKELALAEDKKRRQARPARKATDKDGEPAADLAMPSQSQDDASALEGVKGPMRGNRGAEEGVPSERRNEPQAKVDVVRQTSFAPSLGTATESRGREQGEELGAKGQAHSDGADDLGVTRRYVVMTEGSKNAPLLIVAGRAQAECVRIGLQAGADEMGSSVSYTVFPCEVWHL